VKIDSGYVHCLLYADDIALLSESEDDLQSMLDILYKWCRNWRMKVNSLKSNIVHFRPKRIPRSDYIFKYHGQVLSYCKSYKYLGIVIDEFLDYHTTAGVLADSAGRALGGIYSKYKSNKGLGFKTYTTLYNSGVTPILDYCSGVWGFNVLENIDTIQNRAIRLFLGVHKFAPNKAINADAGWVHSRTRRHLEILRLWNKLVSMPTDRLTRKIFEWDKINRRGWCNNVFNIMEKIYCAHCFNDNLSINIPYAKTTLHQLYCEQWKQDICNIPKLRTYVRYKTSYNAEPYMYNVHNKGHRSALAQFRCGILPLKIETGRFMNIPLEFRLCIFCDNDCIEDEFHFLFDCKLYTDLRNTLISKAVSYVPCFNTLDINGKMICLKLLSPLT
jgi:hypothetical protein